MCRFPSALPEAQKRGVDSRGRQEGQIDFNAQAPHPPSGAAYSTRDRGSGYGREPLDDMVASRTKHPVDETRVDILIARGRIQRSRQTRPRPNWPQSGCPPPFQGAPLPKPNRARSGCPPPLRFPCRCMPIRYLSFPKIQSGGIRAVRQNQRIIQCDVCDHPPTCNVHSRSVQAATSA
jgi:hypothetical protein